MIPCYACNVPLTEEELQHWLPFDLCKKCKKAHAHHLEQVRRAKRLLPLYWRLKPEEQAEVLQINE